MDAANADAKSVGRMNPSHISLKQSSKWFLLIAFVDVSSALCKLRLGVGASAGDAKDTDLEIAAGGVNAWQSTIDDEETTTATTQTLIANVRGVILVLAVWRFLCWQGWGASNWSVDAQYVQKKDGAQSANHPILVHDWEPKRREYNAMQGTPAL